MFYIEKRQSDPSYPFSSALTGFLFARHSLFLKWTRTSTLHHLLQLAEFLFLAIIALDVSLTTHMCSPIRSLFPFPLFSGIESEVCYYPWVSWKRRRRAPEITYRTQGHPVHITSFISLSSLPLSLMESCCMGWQGNKVRRACTRGRYSPSRAKQDKVFSLTCPPINLLEQSCSLFLCASF